MSERLYFLIKSLNQKEKNHFSRQYGNKDALYFDIYKTYQNAKEFNKVKLEQTLKKKWKNKNFRQSNIYLEKIIIKTLSETLERPKVLSDLKQLKELAEVQASKGNFQQVLKSYEKTYLLTKDAALHLEHADACIRWIYTLTVLSPKELIENREHLYNDLDENAELIKAYLTSWKMYVKCLIRANKSLKLLPNETKKDILKKIATINKAHINSKSVIANYFFLESKFIYYNVLEDYKSCFDTCAKQLEIFEQNELFKQQRINSFAQKNAHVLMLLDVKKQKKATAIAIKQKMNEIDSKKVDFLMVKFLVDIMCLKFTLSSSNIKAQIADLQQFEKDFDEKFKHFTIDLKLYLFVQFAYLNFILKKFEKSLDWVIRFENEDKKYVRKDLLTKIKLIGILNHYHLKNHIALPYYIKQTYRILLNKVALDPFEKWLLSSIRKLNREGFSIELAKTLLQQYEDKKTEEEYTFVNVFDYSYWLKSLIKKKSYLEIWEMED